MGLFRREKKVHPRLPSVDDPVWAAIAFVETESGKFVLRPWINREGIAIVEQQAARDPENILLGKFLEVLRHLTFEQEQKQQQESRQN